MSKILFVCTGNIFRSMSAEYFLRAALPEHSGISVSSAGTSAEPAPGHMVHPVLHAYLNDNGIDVSRHKQTKVTPELLAQQDLVIAMSTDHKAFLQSRFNAPSHLFFEASHGETRPFLDLWEEVPDYNTNFPAAKAYIHKAVDMIREASPLIVRRLPLLLKS